MDIKPIQSHHIAQPHPPTYLRLLLVGIDLGGRTRLADYFLDLLAPLLRVANELDLCRADVYTRRVSTAPHPCFDDDLNPNGPSRRIFE